MFCKNLFLVVNDLNLNLQLDRNIHSLSIARFRFSNVYTQNQELKKDGKCSQNLDLNPACAC